MPDGGAAFDDKALLLAPSEYEAVARVAVDLGVTQLKITGGEPTIRSDVVEIVERLASLGADDVSMTTNGLKLVARGEALRRAGLNRVTVSLDSLKSERYRSITGGGRLDLALAGLHAASDLFESVKINVVVMRGVNLDEVAAFAALTYEHPWTVRFIEFMPIGSSVLADTSWADTLVSAEETKQAITAELGALSPVHRASEPGLGPANVFQLDGAKGRVGFIHAMSQPFCESCNRLRLTARGELRACLFDGGELPLVEHLRPTVDAAALRRAFEACVTLKPTVHALRGTRAMSQLGG